MKTTRRFAFAAIPALTLATIDVFAGSYPGRRITMVNPSRRAQRRPFAFGNRHDRGTVVPLVP